MWDKEYLDSVLDNLTTAQQIKAETMLGDLLGIQLNPNSNVPNINSIPRTSNKIILLDFFDYCSACLKSNLDVYSKIFNLVNKFENMKTSIIFVLDKSMPISLRDFDFKQIIKDAIKKKILFVYDSEGNSSSNIIKTISDEYAMIKKSSIIITSNRQLDRLQDEYTKVVDLNLRNHIGKEFIKNFKLAKTIYTNTESGVNYFLKVLKDNKCFDISK